jgi:hypothetical protein
MAAPAESGLPLRAIMPLYSGFFRSAQVIGVVFTTDLFTANEATP